MIASKAAFKIVRVKLFKVMQSLIISTSRDADNVNMQISNRTDRAQKIKYLSRHINQLSALVTSGAGDQLSVCGMLRLNNFISIYGVA